MEDSYYRWKKGQIEQLSVHFTTSEFSCQCHHPECIDQKVAIELIEKLEQVRVLLDEPMTITSGYRCEKHQKELGLQGKETAKKLSQHELGRAADIMAHDFNMLKIHCEKEFKAIGYSKRFLHVDLRSDRTRLWKYNY